MLFRIAAGAGVLARVALAGMALSAAAVGEEERAVPRIERKEVEETLSTSGQFLARGPGKAGRALVVTRAEEVREEVSRFLDRLERRGETAETGFGSGTEESADVLVIHLWIQGGAAPPLQPRLYRVDGVPKPVLGLVMARAELAEGEAFRKELVRLLLVERMYRHQPGEAGRGEALPAWLETGVLVALDHIRAGRPSERFASVFARGGLLSVDDILSTRPDHLEAAAREAYAVSAGCLVMALLDQPGGPERFRRFLEAVPTREGGWQNLLVRQFPGLALSQNSLEKWWALQAATLATPDLLEPMTAAETDRWLEQVLMVRPPPAAAAKDAPAASPVVRWFKSWFPGRSKAGAPAAPEPVASPSADGAVETPATEVQVYGLDELDQIAALPNRQAVLKANQAGLAGLLLRAFPLHRPIIEEYQQVFGLLAQGKTKGLADRCAGLATRRREVLATAEAVTDLLNWHEATQRSRLSGSFDRYFQMLDEPAPQPPRGTADPISRTLDELEVEFAPE